MTWATDDEMALWFDAMVRGDGRDKAGNTYTDDDLHRVAYLTVRELSERNATLTRQLDDARDKAINAGIFTSSDGDESKYTHALNDEECETCGHSIYGPDDLFAGCCGRCETEISTPGATSYKP